ncbi:hypothetical protein I552_0222 [Mycobacterium xenopi 3993]|nr:hypothetical protein I552_0222 [Mycobacterium xenopi 3993]
MPTPQFWHDDLVRARSDRLFPGQFRNPRRQRLLALALLALVTPTIAGCVRIKATITISPDDLVSGQIIAATKARNDKDTGPQLDPNLPFSQKVAITKYDKDGYVGSEAVFSELTFAELPQLANMHPDAAGVNLSLRRSGNLVILEGRADLTSLTDPEADVELSVSFPGAVTSTNGERVDTDVVTWKLKPGVVSTMNAQARYTDPSTRSFANAAVWLGISSFVVAGVVALLAWQARDRSPRFTAPDDYPRNDRSRLGRRPVVKHLCEGFERGCRDAVGGFEMDAQREAEVGDTVDHTLVQVHHQLAFLRRFAAGQRSDECLFLRDGGVARILDQPADEPHPVFHLRNKAERQQYLGPVIGVLGEFGQKTHDRVGIQQLGLGESGAPIALERKPALLTRPGGNQDHAAVRHQFAINRQRIGRRHTRALAVVHGARYTDEHDAVHPRGDQIGEPLAQGGLVHKSGDLAAQSAHPRQLRFDQRPEVEHVKLRFHFDRPVILLSDQSGNHHVPDVAVDTGFRG